MKTNLKKRLLSLLLGAVMLISLFSTAVTAWADATYVGGNVYDAEVTFTLKDAGSRFSGTAAIINGDLATRVISLTDNEMVVRVSFVSDDNTSSIIGDLDGDGEATDADAIYLLMYTFFPEEYPIV